MPGDLRTNGGRALFGFGLAALIAAAAGLLNGVDEAPWIAGIGACLLALGWWVRATR